MRKKSYLDTKKTVRYGTIAWVKPNELRVDCDILHNYIIAKDEYHDISKYSCGQAVVVIEYEVLGNVCRGICDKSKYDNAVRDSQKIPDDWVCEPKVEEIEIHGILKKSVNMLYTSAYVYPDGDLNNPIFFERPLLIDAASGDRVKVMALKVTYPDGKPRILRAEIYDEEIVFLDDNEKLK